jgi:hypothetical protein
MAKSRTLIGAGDGYVRGVEGVSNGDGAWVVLKAEGGTGRADVDLLGGVTGASRPEVGVGAGVVLPLRNNAFKSVIV